LTSIHPAQWYPPKFNGVPEAEINLQGSNGYNEKLVFYETVTSLIIERLENGVIPWVMTWKTIDSMPCNLISKKPYRGFNFWYLLSFGFERPYFLTFNQVKELGAYNKKGSKSFMVTFFGR